MWKILRGGGDKASFWQCESGLLNGFDSEAFHAPNLMHYLYSASNDCFASNGCTFDVINRRTLLIWHSEGLKANRYGDLYYGGRGCVVLERVRHRSPPNLNI